MTCEERITKLEAELQSLRDEYDQEVISHDIEEQDLKAKVRQLREENAQLLKTLTMAQAEGTRLVLENRDLKSKLSGTVNLGLPKHVIDHNEAYDFDKRADED